MSTVEFTEADRTEALAILGRFQQIVDNEALVRGRFVTAVVAPERADAVCGGRNACAIGSLWLAAGVQPIRIGMGNGWRLPGVERRREFLEDRPALRLAYDAANEAAAFYADQAGIAIHYEFEFEGHLENLFETGARGDDRDELIDPSELTHVIAIARDRITDMALAS